jgi:hypothetical protein
MSAQAGRQVSKLDIVLAFVFGCLATRKPCAWAKRCPPVTASSVSE